MKIALIGYGKMGKAIEQIALGRGHEIVSVVDVNNPEEIRSERFKSADVAIEFTTPATAFDNYMQCFAAGVPVVSGTTGWLDRLDEVKAMCANEGKTFFYASNFSIGVNIFFALNKYLAKIMNGFPAYDVRLTETHHIHKLDAPSGTAITLAEGILENVDRKERWTLETAEQPTDLMIHAIREGEVPGIHEKGKCPASMRLHTNRMSIRFPSSMMPRAAPDLRWGLWSQPSLRQGRKDSWEWMIC